MRETIKSELAEATAELRAHMATWEYAFAMGAGCTVGERPESHAVRRRVADLRARIAELRAD